MNASTQYASFSLQRGPQGAELHGLAGWRAVWPDGLLSPCAQRPTQRMLRG